MLLANGSVQFLHNEGDEKKALIPIIEKLLLLSPQEVKYLSDTLVRGTDIIWGQEGRGLSLHSHPQGKRRHCLGQNSTKTQTLPRTPVGLVTSTDGQATDDFISYSPYHNMYSYTGLNSVQCAA